MTQNDAGNAGGVDAQLARHGKLSYLQIPAIDVETSAAFYTRVFGWTLRGGSARHRSFTDTSGQLIGAFVTGRAVAREPGLLLYVYVESVEATLQQIQANGGEVVKPPYSEGPLLVATFRDPAGNILGLWTAGGTAPG